MDASNKINSDLEYLLAVSDAHSLKIDPSKSAAVIFGHGPSRRFILDNINIRINGLALTVVDESRNLGIILDDKLRYKTHCTNNKNSLREP